MKLTDFGIAKLTGEPSLTLNEQLFGTPGYIAPEYVGGVGIDGRSDIYSLAVVVYEMICGVLPFDGQGSVRAAAQAADLRSDPAEPAHLGAAARSRVALASLPRARIPTSDRTTRSRCTMPSQDIVRRYGRLGSIAPPERLARVTSAGAARAAGDHHRPRPRLRRRVSETANVGASRHARDELALVVGARRSRSAHHEGAEARRRRTGERLLAPRSSRSWRARWCRASSAPRRWWASSKRGSIASRRRAASSAPTSVTPSTCSFTIARASARISTRCARGVKRSSRAIATVESSWRRLLELRDGDRRPLAGVPSAREGDRAAPADRPTSPHDPRAWEVEAIAAEERRASKVDDDLAFQLDALQNQLDREERGASSASSCRRPVSSRARSRRCAGSRARSSAPSTTASASCRSTG